MPEEIEIKIKVDAHDAVRTALRAAGAACKGKVRETNLFFDREGGALRARDQGLRVRLSQREDGRVETLLTFKGPAGKTGLRTREAFDVLVTPGEQMVPMLEALGYERVLLFEKDRESWELGGCLVELDTMPEFGMFVEVEGPSVEAVRGVQERIGLGGAAAHRPSYSRMVGEWASAHGSKALRFV